MNARPTLPSSSLAPSLALALVLASIAGCYTGATLAPEDPPTSSAGGGAAGAGPGVTANSGLPCDVAKVVSDSCASCHGAKPTGGAKSTLVNVEGFLAPSSQDPAKTVGVLAVERMKDAKDPMPASGLLPAADVAVIETWVKAGMPRGTCATLPNASDPFFDKVVECSSGGRWTRGDRGSAQMHPGRACVDCHRTAGEREAAIYTIAGTVYATGHEVNDCNGTNGATSGAKIVVTESGGKVTTLAVNSAGNFYSTARFTTPYTVKVVQGAKERVMKAVPSSGDCNSCHTKDGAEGAPGRIALPE